MGVYFDILLMDHIVLSYLLLLLIQRNNLYVSNFDEG